MANEVLVLSAHLTKPFVLHAHWTLVSLLETQWIVPITGDELDGAAKGVTFWFAAFQDTTKIEMVPLTHAREVFANKRAN